MEGRDAPGTGPGGSGNMQVPYGILQHRGGGMGGPQSGGMGAGPGQVLHAPAPIRPSPPSQGGTNSGGGGPAQEGGPVGPHPIMSMPPSMGMGMGMTTGPLAGSEQPPKKKRGRPRKNAAGGESSPGVPSASTFPGLAAALPSSSVPYTPSPEKRGRGRLPGSGKKQKEAAVGAVRAGAGQGFTPHILTVNAGEDVSTKIMQFAQLGPLAMCVLSANGAVSNVILRQQSSSGGTVTYEGRYEILSLSGSYLPTDVGGARQRTGGLSVSLAGSDGRVFGGGVAGMLTAASPIQVVVGTFLSDPKPQLTPESPLRSTQGGTSGGASDPGTQRPPTSISGPEGSSAGPQHQGPPAASPSGQSAGQQGMAMFPPSGGWANPHVLGDAWRTHMNISLPGSED